MSRTTESFQVGFRCDFAPIRGVSEDEVFDIFYKRAKKMVSSFEGELNRINNDIMPALGTPEYDLWCNPFGVCELEIPEDFNADAPHWEFWVEVTPGTFNDASCGVNKVWKAFSDAVKYWAGNDGYEARPASYRTYTRYSVSEFSEPVVPA